MGVVGCGHRVGNPSRLICVHATSKSTALTHNAIVNLMIQC